MPNYNIAGMKIAINYRFDHFFQNSIEAYRISDKESVNYKMESFLVDHIDLPKDHIKSDTNPHLINIKNKRIVYAVSPEGMVKSLIEHDLTYRHCKLYINSSIVKRMAETEYVLMGVIFLEISMREGFLPVHASAILYQDQAILFSAPSKTGKSTHADLWKQVYPEIEYINDDKPLLKIVGGQKAINTNRHAPLKSIVFLSQGKTNTMKRATIDEALNLLMKNMLRPSDEENWNKALKTIEFIIKTIPIYTLDATKDEEAVYAVKKVIFEGEEHI